ncbi:hypothetical protein B0T13DRAFT_426484 [Neurospora crassa]|nr:hypothetical protein B0T13DRAFT_426484 [Neurospora crassa]
MSFINEAFIANSARAVHPQSPSPFYFGDSSDFLCEQLANLCFCETHTNDELEAGNGLVFNRFQVARRKASVNTTPPLEASPRSTSSYHTSSLYTSPYGTSACPTPSNGTASVATSPHTSPFQGTSPHLTPPYSNSTDIGHLDGKNDLRENYTKGQMKQSGAGGFLNDKSPGFNFHLGNLSSYSDQSMSRHPGPGHENPGCTPGNAKNLDGVGVHDDHRNNRELRHLAEFQNWVLGLDTSTMLRTAEQAGFPLDLGFKSNSSNHGRMKSTEGQGMSTTALTSTPHGYSAENNTASLHNFFAKSLPFRPAIASKRKCDDRSADKDAICKTRSDAIAVPSLSGATPVAFTPVRAVAILPSSSSGLFAGSAKTRARMERGGVLLPLLVGRHVGLLAH